MTLETTKAFRHDTPKLRTVLTDNCANSLLEEMTHACLGRAMIVCSVRQKDGALVRQIAGTLGDHLSCVFDGVSSHPTLAVAAQGAAMAQERDVDCLIALGGGGSSDLAKGIALWLAEDGDMRPISFGNPGRLRHLDETRKPALPILAVPTTASGAEMTPGFGQRDESGRKLLFRDERLFVRLVVLDPSAALDTPADILIPTCMNAIAHCVEALYSTQRDPISDSYAGAALDRLIRGIRWLREEPDGIASRREILIGANLAGRAIVNARTCLHHATCHALGAAGVSHGAANAIFLPHALRFNGSAAGPLLRPAERAFGVDGPEALADALDLLCRGFDIPRRLRDVGLERSQLATIADHIMKEPGLRFNPRQPLAAAEIAGLLDQAW